MDSHELSRVLSAVIGILTDPYDKFIEQLHTEGRITDEELQSLRRALEGQIPQVSKLVRASAGDGAHIPEDPL